MNISGWKHGSCRWADPFPRWDLKLIIEFETIGRSVSRYSLKEWRRSDGHGENSFHRMMIPSSFQLSCPVAAAVASLSSCLLRPSAWPWVPLLNFSRGFKPSFSEGTFYVIPRVFQSHQNLHFHPRNCPPCKTISFGSECCRAAASTESVKGIFKNVYW